VGQEGGERSSCTAGPEDFLSKLLFREALVQRVPELPPLVRVKYLGFLKNSPGTDAFFTSQ